MSEPKAKTLQERFGFADPDLKTPKHDAIMFWLDTEMPAVLSQLFGAPKWEYLPRFDFNGGYSLSDEVPPDRCSGEIQSMQEKINADLRVAPVPLRSVTKTWERPIIDRARNGAYTIGFADMLVTWTDQIVSCHFGRVSYKTWEYRSSEIEYGYRRAAYFEVKPSIPSLGELVRQLRMYKTYTEDIPWVVVSPDVRFADKLKEQGFGFIQVPPEV